MISNSKVKIDSLLKNGAKVYMKHNLVFGIKNRQIGKLIVILVISTLAATVIQFIKGDLIQSALNLNKHLAIQFSVLYGGLMLIEVFFYYLEWLFENKLTRKTIYQLKQGIANNVFNRNKKISETTVRNSTQVINNSIGNLEYPYYMAWYSNFYLILRVVFVTVSIFYISYLAGLVIILLMVLPLIVTKLFKKTIAEKKKKYLDAMGVNLSNFENIIQNFQYIQIFNISDFLRSKFQKGIEVEQDSGINAQNYQLTLNTIYSLVSYFSSFVALIISAFLIANGRITIGTAVTLLGLIDQLSLPVLSISRNINSINSTKDIREEINNSIVNNRPAKKVVQFKNKIQTSNLVIELDKKKLIYPDITIASNKSYLIKGKSGIGKSVFLKAILGLTTSTDGDIYYDDKKIDDNVDVFADIAYILADNSLFNMSVLENVLFDKNITVEQRKLVKMLLPVDVLESEKVNSLSSGEDRRVLLLRGLLSNKKMLVFDEPTANLDPETSEIFWKIIFNWQKSIDGTLVVVSHTIDSKNEKQFDYLLNFDKLIRNVD